MRQYSRSAVGGKGASSHEACSRTSPTAVLQNACFHIFQFPKAPALQKAPLRFSQLHRATEPLEQPPKSFRPLNTRLGFTLNFQVAVSILTLSGAWIDRLGLADSGRDCSPCYLLAVSSSVHLPGIAGTAPSGPSLSYPCRTVRLSKYNVMLVSSLPKSTSGGQSEVPLANGFMTVSERCSRRWGPAKSLLNPFPQNIKTCQPDPLQRRAVLCFQHRWKASR